MFTSKSFDPPALERLGKMTFGGGQPANTNTRTLVWVNGAGNGAGDAFVVSDGGGGGGG